MISLVPHLLVLLLAFKAHKGKSLTPLGIAASIITGLIHTSHPWIVYFLLLAGFYLSSSKFTKLKSDIKAQLTVQIDAGKNDNNHQEQRTHIQVFANSIVASILILLHHRFLENDLLVIGIISHYAAVTADTWSSELGILSKSEPILITTLKKCPKGTNGGVSPLGLGVALLAGIYISVLSIVALKLQGITISALDESVCSHLKFIIFFAIVGLFGSLLDSLLGAVFQKSVVNEKGLILEAKGGGIVKGDKEDKSKIVSGQLNLLSNNQVNLLMALLTTFAGMGLWRIVN